ncbi:hypothetical protein GGP41_008492 [Bipolaris sorokiniana]|uniref:Uncharacterized protein n=1 Tax=Cochliobolus sativus TaxID=45130 RepID=A0A8H5ZDF9_COCSA|nr:hypothetical protein GGP41_008492 [Bipolaris sorokiniana]
MSPVTKHFPNLGAIYNAAPNVVSKVKNYFYDKDSVLNPKHPSTVIYTTSLSITVSQISTANTPQHKSVLYPQSACPVPQKAASTPQTSTAFTPPFQTSYETTRPYPPAAVSALEASAPKLSHAHCASRIKDVLDGSSTPLAHRSPPTVYQRITPASSISV